MKTASDTLLFWLSGWGAAARRWRTSAIELRMVANSYGAELITTKVDFDQQSEELYALKAANTQAIADVEAWKGKVAGLMSANRELVRSKEPLIDALRSARGGLCVAAIKDGTAEMIDSALSCYE